MNYKNKQRERVKNLFNAESDIFNGDKGNGVFRGRQYAFVLNDCKNNLYTPIHDETLRYFKLNKIEWWGGNHPTTHPLSSQIACINHLFPLRHDEEAVCDIANGLCPEITKVHRITSDKHNPGFVQFEAVSDDDLLNEKCSTRGRNCTSVDALILGSFENGSKILILIEWKYVETYGDKDYTEGESGKIRGNRYNNLITQSEQITGVNKILYFEPFYQLMRQTLWAEQMTHNKDNETVQANDFFHIHVIPSQNDELLDKTYMSGMTMEKTWRECLLDQSKYRIITPEELLSPINNHKYSALIDYLRTRYW